MAETTLQLLTSEGPLAVTFRPVLDARQYNILADLITGMKHFTKQEFRDHLAQLAAEWGISFESDYRGDG